MLSSEDTILTKSCRKLKDFLPEGSAKNPLIKIEKTNIARLSAKIAYNRFD